MAFELTNLVGAFFVIGLWSILLKNNILYRFCERVFLGLALGVTITMSVQTILNKCIIPISGGNLSPIVPAVLGIMMLTRLVKGKEWMSVYPIVLITGIGLALMTRTAIEAQIISQFKPVVTNKLITNSLYTTTGNIFAFFGLILGILFFLFATNVVPNNIKPQFSWLQKIGRYVIMMMLGASFAANLMGRESMLLERLLFLLQTFGIVH